jgi:glucose-6-phosphate isomerase
LDELEGDCMSPFMPFNIDFSSAPARFEPNDLVIERSLSDSADIYYDQETAAKMLEQGDPPIVKVWMAPLPEEGGHLMSCLTIIYPGKVGDEYFMSKGHIHTEDVYAPEYYITLKGQGKLVLQTRSGEVFVADMLPGLMNYIPGEWAHRTVNTGREDFVFLGIFPAAAKRDYSFMILVTGGNGYVGRALCRRLAENGHTVCSVSRRQYDTERYLSLVGDVSDKASLEAIFNQYQVDTVVHLASMLNSASRQHPDQAVRVNVVGSLNLMEACRDRGGKRLSWALAWPIRGLSSLSRLVCQSSLALVSPAPPRPGAPTCLTG